MEKSEAARVFISYRRQETAWPARQLYDVLVAELGANRVFKDVDNIEPGDDFVERIQSAVGSCQVLLALIGPQWLTITDAKGERRLDDPEDFVRLEVETALSRDDVRVIPILVDDAKMPRPQDLPMELAALTRRQAVEINPVDFDTRRLMRVLNDTFKDVRREPSSISGASAGLGLVNHQHRPSLRSKLRLQLGLAMSRRRPDREAIERQPEDERGCWWPSLLQSFCWRRLALLCGISRASLTRA